MLRKVGQELAPNHVVPVLSRFVTNQKKFPALLVPRRFDHLGVLVLVHRFRAFIALDGRSSQTRDSCDTIDQFAYTLGVSNLMSPEELTLRDRRDQTQAALVEAPYTISASVRVRAEARRLFQALTVPEYLEAWLRVPEVRGSSVVTPLHQPAGFALDWCNADETRSRILAVYKTCRRRRLMICWRLERNQLYRESSVTMRLTGDFGCSVVSLFHSGFRTFDDFDWHRKFWNASLERLSKLF